jgi:replicative DNA helicase
VTEDTDLPRNIEAEAALLGAMMIDNSIIDTVADRVATADFFEPLHGRLFETITTLAGQGKVANPVTVKPFFEADEAMKEVGGVGYLAKLTGSGAGLIGARDFAAQIHDLAKLRGVIALAENLAAKARDTATAIDPEALISEAEEGLAGIAGDNGEATTFQLADCMGQVEEEWERPPTGVLSGSIISLDKTMGRSRPDDLIILAGRPGMGKTAVAISYAVGVARQAISPMEDDRADGGGVAFISLEMSALQIGQRALADIAAYSHPIAFASITNGWMGRDQKDRARAIREDARKLPLSVVDTASLTIPRLDGIVRRLSRSFAAKGVPLRLVVVDYLQLMSAGRTSSNRTEEVTHISRGLKQIAKRHKVAVMALSQLSRQVEAREDKRPQLSDLRESGSIEQDADKIVFVYRESYYHERKRPTEADKMYETRILEWEADREALKDKIEFIVAKRRDGPEGTAVGQFVRENQAVRGAVHG